MFFDVNHEAARLALQKWFDPGRVLAVGELFPPRFLEIWTHLTLLLGGLSGMII
jgi:hypothetical protein